MAQAHDIQIGPVVASIVVGSYRRRNTRAGGRPASSRRLIIDAFRGQRQAFGTEDGGRGTEEGTGWDALGVGPVFEGKGVEPFPNVASFSDASVLDVPDVANPRAYGVAAGNNAFIGMGRRIYKSVVLSNGTWSALTAAADLGAGFAISGLAYYQDDLLVMLSSGQDIRKFNTGSGSLTIWRTGEKGQVGCGYAGQMQ